MNYEITGKTIKELREKQGLTQLQLANMLNVSDKAISKWETGKGFPDTTMFESLSKVLHASITELFSGNTITNNNMCCNLMKSKIYVCKKCGNVIFATGDASISCCGETLKNQNCSEQDLEHKIETEIIENEIYVKVNHEMTKNHYISFIAYLFDDRFEIVKLYPEQEPSCRFMYRGYGKILIFCNNHGLFSN